MQEEEKVQKKGWEEEKEERQYRIEVGKKRRRGDSTELKLGRIEGGVTVQNRSWEEEKEGRQYRIEVGKKRRRKDSTE